jgi:hypothetical protein
MNMGRGAVTAWRMGGAGAGTDLVGGVALVAKAAILLAGAGQAAQLAVLVHRLHNPVNPGVLHTDAPPLTHVHPASCSFAQALQSASMQAGCKMEGPAILEEGWHVAV